MPIDNDLYNHTQWWDEDEALYMLRTSLNPCRFAYFREVLTDTLGIAPQGQRALDIGCGGGFLAEEFAALGCQVTGIDPSAPTIAQADAHAKEAGLTIAYRVASGETIPFADASFDIAYCCDVLEHVNDLDTVIAETARVLKPGGVYFYDTINRTPLSRLLGIKVMQEWKWSRFGPPNLHEWEKFIKPRELRTMMARHGLEDRAIAGMRPNVNPIAMIRALRAHKRGEISSADLGARMPFVRSKDTQMSYMGYAIKSL